MLVHTVAATEQDRHTYASSKPVSSVAFRVIAAESAAVEKQQTIHVAITHYWNVRHVWCQSSRRNASRQTVRCRVIDNFWGAFYCSSMANSTLNQSWMIHHDLQHTDKDGQIGNRWRTVAFTVTNWDQGHIRVVHLAGRVIILQSGQYYWLNTVYHPSWHSLGHFGGRTITAA